MALLPHHLPQFALDIILKEIHVFEAVYCYERQVSRWLAQVLEGMSKFYTVGSESIHRVCKL